MTEAKLISVCDINIEKAAKLAGQYGCQYDTGIEALLGRADIDVVCVCTPSGLHREHGIMAARARKHVIVEKPIEVTRAAADDLIRECREEGVILSVISQHRFDDDIVRLKETIQEGKLGQLNFGGFHTKWFRSQNYYDSGAVGIIEGNTAAFPGYFTRLDIYGTDGSVVIMNDKILNWNLKCEGVTEADFGSIQKDEKISNSGAISFSTTF